MKRILVLITVIWSYLDAYPQTANNWYDKGTQSEEPQTQVEFFSKAIALDPDHSPSYHGRGFALYSLGRHREAIRDFTKVIELDRNPVSFFNRGYIFSLLERYQDAINDYSTSIDLDSSFEPAFSLRGYAWYLLGRYEKALDDFNQAITLDPESAIHYKNRGFILAKLGWYKDAIVAYNKSIEMNSKDPSLYHDRGVVLEILGQDKEAISDFNKSIELDPGYTSAYNQRGFSLAKVGRYEEALSDFTIANERDPANAVYLGNLKKLKKFLDNNQIKREPKLWVLAVGLNFYQYDFLLPNLNYSEQHAFEFARYLERTGLTNNRKIEVLNHNRGQRSTIINYIRQELCNNQVSEDDLVIFYFSGHGLNVNNTIGICPADYVNANQLITDDDIIGILGESRARHKIIFIESCKSDVQEMSPISEDERRRLNEKRNKIGNGLVYITSTFPGGKSYQVPPKGGLFSYYLLKGLEGEADSNNNSIVETKELFDYIKLEVSRETKSNQVPQINSLGYDLNLPITAIY